MSLDSLDKWLTDDRNDHPYYYCLHHDFVYIDRCPHCADDEADRRYDAQKEQRP